MATLRGITASEVRLFLGHGGKELTNKTLGQPGIKSSTPLVFLPEYYKNIQKGNYGETPLSIASFSGREDVVRLLLDNGADVNKADKLGTTPLSIASRLGKKHIVEALLKAPDIKVDKSDTFPKKTPLF